MLWVKAAIGIRLDGTLMYINGIIWSPIIIDILQLL